ncbi:hypothetical protein Taro_011627, partial [Colocasia esculenta]|nr:hypothetical protein [Colocasia esculenta]
SLLALWTHTSQWPQRAASSTQQKTAAPSSPLQTSHCTLQTSQQHKPERPPPLMRASRRRPPLDAGHTVHDSFLGARIFWTNVSNAALVLSVCHQDKRRVLRPYGYLDHVESVAEEIELRRREAWTDDSTLFRILYSSRVAGPTVVVGVGDATPPTVVFSNRTQISKFYPPSRLWTDPARLPYSVRVRGGAEEEGKAPRPDEGERRRRQPPAASPMMAAKPQQQMGGGGGENLTVQIAGMSKTQLYDIMCQMKNLIEQNPQQARQILIDNPPLTKALFQAQIMLGMVQPPKVMPNIQQPSTQQSQPPSQLQASQSLTSQAGSQGEYVTKPQVPVRQQQQSQSTVSVSSVSIPPLAFQSQAMPPHTVPPVQQAKGTLSTQLSNQISSQIQNLPPPPPPVPQQSILPTHISMVPGQSQPPLQTSNVMLPPLQPPLPQQPRPSSIQPFQQHLYPQIPTGLGFQVPSSHQQLLSQPLFHPGVNPPTSFPQGQPPLPNQPLPQQIYQGASHITSDFSGSAQVDRASSWAPGLPERATPLAGVPPIMTGQMGPSPGGQPFRPSQLTAEMEQALLQQVMSLTPEQINQLPPEHRNQVFQIQQMYRR